MENDFRPPPEPDFMQDIPRVGNQKRSHHSDQKLTVRHRPDSERPIFGSPYDKLLTLANSPRREREQPQPKNDDLNDLVGCFLAFMVGVGFGIALLADKFLF